MIRCNVITVLMRNAVMQSLGRGSCKWILASWEWVLGGDLGSGSWEWILGVDIEILGVDLGILGVDLGSGSWDLESGSWEGILGGDLGRKSTGIALIDEQ
jgi:hypothetical protein